MNNETIDNKIGKTENNSMKKMLAKIVSLAVAGSITLAGLTLVRPEPKLMTLRDFSSIKLKYMQRDGSRHYESERYEQIDSDTKKRVVTVYSDIDNNGAPDKGFCIFPDGTVRIDTYSNKLDNPGYLLSPIESKYIKDGKLVEHVYWEK